MSNSGESNIESNLVASAGTNIDTNIEAAPTRCAVDKKTICRWRRYLAEERLEADTYRVLARRRTGVEREIFERLVAAEERHERHWLNLLGEDALPEPKAPFAARLLNGMAQSFGSVFILATMQRAEDRTAYDDDCDAPQAMAADEHIHGEVVRALAAQRRQEMAGSLRAAVFGVNDGLVSNIALIMGMVAAGVNRTAVVAAGLAGLLAGALSMAAGEYVSVRSQRELLESSHSSPTVRQAVESLDMKENELELVFLARGDSAEVAREKAKRQFESMARLDEIEVVSAGHVEVGSATRAALSSMCFFAIGAAIPLIPFLLSITQLHALIAATVAVGLALMLTGGVVGLLSGVSPLSRGLRQLAIGAVAATVTYLLGLAFGVVTG